MPIIDPEIMHAGEKELFSFLLKSFKEFRVEKLFQETHELFLKEKMKFKKGNTIVYDNQIAYKFDFMSVALFSVLIDELGTFSGFTDPNAFQFLSGEDPESNDKIIDAEIVKLRKSEFLDSLSANISERTLRELFRKIYKVQTVGKMIYQQGRIVIFNNAVTYQFLYEVEAIFSVLIDREGNYINTSKENNVSPLKADAQDKLHYK